MSNKFILFFLILIGYFQSIAQSSNSKKWIDNELSNLTILEDNISFDSYGCDLSNALTFSKNNIVLGFIGDNFQQLKMKFISVTWNKQKLTSFNVKGKSQVKNIITDFTGTIDVVRFLRIKNDNSETDESNIVIAKYKFFENKNQKFSGIFEGYLIANLTCTESVAKYYDNDVDADGFSNNQYIGTWTSYTNNTIKKCNWGDYRIPDCGDLDIGAGEFLPNTKYLKFGWQNYYNAYAKNDKAAIVQENIKWWTKK